MPARRRRGHAVLPRADRQRAGLVDRVGDRGEDERPDRDHRDEVAVHHVHVDDPRPGEESDRGADDWWPRGVPDTDPVGALTALRGG